jgi:hypothetical protein
MRLSCLVHRPLSSPVTGNLHKTAWRCGRLCARPFTLQYAQGRTLVVTSSVVAAFSGPAGFLGVSVASSGACAAVPSGSTVYLSNGKSPPCQGMGVGPLLARVVVQVNVWHR